MTISSTLKEKRCLKIPTIRYICWLTKLHFPWRFDKGLFEPLGHGFYDLMNYNESLVENRVTTEELTVLFNDLSKSHYWIPKFPTEFRSHVGIVISIITIIWVSVFLFLGGTHYVIGVGGLLAAVAALVFALIAGRVMSTFIGSVLEASYLNNREKEFLNICDDWNEKMKEKGVRLDVGRYGAYIVLEFKKCLVGLGKYLMKAKKISETIKKRKADEQEKEMQKAEDEDQY